MRDDDPRARRSRTALLDAAGRVLAEHGPAGVTVDAVATAAGVARTTVYRHFPDLGDLVVDAVAHAAPHGAEVDTGEVAEDLVLLLGGLDRGLAEGGWARLLPGLLLAAQREPRTAELLSGFVEDRRRHLVLAVDRARDRGELVADASGEQIGDLLAGAVYYRRLLRRTGTDATTLRRLVAATVDPLRPR